MKRRMLSVFLALAMVISMALGVSAAEMGIDTASPLSLEVTQGKGSVAIEVYLEDCEGVTNGALTLGYDADVLTFAQAQPSDACAMSSVNGTVPGTVSYAWVGSELTAEKTLVLTVVLETEQEITWDMTYTVVSDGIYAGSAATAIPDSTLTVRYEEPQPEQTAPTTDPEKPSSGSEPEVEPDSGPSEPAGTQTPDEEEPSEPVEDNGGEDSTVPGTGDSAVSLWAGMMLISGLCVVALVAALLASGRKKSACRVLSVLLVLALALPMIPLGAKAEDADADGKIIDAETGEEVGTVTQLEGVNADLKLDQNLLNVESALYDDGDPVRIIIELETEGLLEQGYTMSQIAAYGSGVSKDAAKLEKEQNALAAKIEKIVAKSGYADGAQVKYSYTVALNGISMTVPYGALAQIRQLDGVAGAYIVSEYLAPDSVESDYDPNMYATSESFGSAQVWQELGYTGAGMTIAIIDTGLDLDHPSFAAAPQGASLDREDIEAVLTELNAYKLFSETSAVALTADKLYRSEKVPFGFNYVDCGLDVTHDYDSQGDHGTHVAGIAAANKLDSTEVVGVAPDAQVVVMKVFGQSGGAYSDDIIAAIEDCILLGVDVINMSLGSQAGFTEDSVLVNEVYGRILETDMILAVAAGNSNSSASYNTLGTNVNLTQDPDNGLVNSPATYLAATAVASLENRSMMMPYFTVGDNKIAYVDVTYYDFAALAGTYEYVVVPGLGDVSDYEGLDVNGKVALVQRGTIDFVSKQLNAYNAGAVAMVCYDNVDGDLISMYNGEYLPNVFISKADGEIMLAAAENGVGTMVIQPYGEETAVPSSVAGLLSDFSCWGVTSDLQLTPDVTAPGGNIYSCYTDGAYGTMSGTSMASPHIAGMSALVLQYLRENYPDMTPSEYHVAAESLVMCTAVPVYDTDGILYSPRKQGAGSANVYNAVTSPVYLTSYQTATGELTPKASLGDDPERTGVYTFSFDIHNLSGTDHTYALGGNVLTDQFVEIDGVEYMSETGRNLEAAVVFELLNDTLYPEYDANLDQLTDMNDVQLLLDVIVGLAQLDETVADKMDLEADGLLNTVDAQLLYALLLEGFTAMDLIVVPTGASVTVNVTVELSDADKAYMEEHYENGIYVDGFVRLYAQSEGAVDLSLPFVGFYGDWTDARMFDNGWYYDPEVNDADESNDYYYNRYLNVIFATLGADSSSAGGLGINPYILEDYDPEHNVLSPNGDTYYDYVNEIYISLMRSAELLDFTWTDDATGEELFYEWYSYARKSYYWTGYGMCMPVIYTDGGCQPYTFYDENGNLTVEDLQHLTLTIRGFLDDGDLDAVQTNADGDPVPEAQWADEVIEVPVVIDLAAPTIDVSSITYSTEDGRNYVTFTVQDNYDIAAVVAMTCGGEAYEYIPVNTKQTGVDGETDVIKLDITDYDAAFRIVVCDYGCNESYYELTNDNFSGLDQDKFYAFRRYSTPIYGDSIYITEELNGWYSFETADDMFMHTSQSESGEKIVYAAEYIDGYIIGAQAGEDSTTDANTLFIMKEGSWERTQLGSSRAMNFIVYEFPGRTETYFPLKLLALDMAYDYTSDTLYMLANGLENNYFPDGAENLLLKVDYTTGAVTFLGIVEAENSEDFLALTLACDNDGVLYTVNYENGKLYTINKEPASVTGRYGYGTYLAQCVSTADASYWPAAYTQSMTVDHETNTLYWAAYQGKVGNSYFIQLDKQTGAILGMTPTEDNAEMVGLFKPYTSGEDIIPDEQLVGMTLNKSALYMSVGETGTLIAMPEPYNADVGTVTWYSMDESVATVSPYGIVEAKGIGSTVIVASNGTFEAECAVSVSSVSGTLYGYSGSSWLLMDAGQPYNAVTVTDAMELDGEVKAAAYYDGWIYAAAVEEEYDDDYNAIYTTNLYKLDPNTLNGQLVGSCDGNITALAFNYADGFMYGMTQSEDTRNWSYNYDLVRVNINTGEIAVAASLNGIFDNRNAWETCSGALAIDYDGNFYVNGDDLETYFDNVLVRFNLDENDAITNVTTYAGFSDYGWSGDAMVWSQRNGGILHVAGTTLEWVDVSDMENVQTIALGDVRSESSNTYALVAFVNQEPELPQVTPAEVILDEVYTVPAGEKVKVIPTLMPWNATPSYTFEVGDESIATVDANGVVTGITIGQTTLTVTVPGTELSATTTIVVEKNPGYLYGFFQADIAQSLPLEYWCKIPLANTADSAVMTGLYDFTIYAASYYDGYIYASGQSGVDGRYYILKISPSNFAYEILAQSTLLIRDMAFDYTTGTMYAVANTEVISGGLYQMNLTSGELTLIADNDMGATLVALAVDDAGTVVVADDYGEVMIMDKHSGELNSTGIYGGYSQYLQSMTYDYNNDAIYWVKGGTMYLVDVENGKLTTLGSADVESGSMVTVGCVVSGLFSVPNMEVQVPETVESAGVVMDEKNTVAVGETLVLDAVVLPVSVATVDQTLTWTSGDETIATVDENGVITGVSAGQVTIYATDSQGNTAATQITVTAEHRYLYGYDEISRSWVSFDFDGAIVNTWADAEGLSPIVAAQYIGDTLYAYDADGYFYTVNTETFERTLLGNGIHGLTVDLEAWDKTHNEQVYYVEDVQYQVIDMTYTTSRRGYVAYAVIMAHNVSLWRDSFHYQVVRIDLSTGEIADVIVDNALCEDMSVRPTNLIYRGGYLYTVNGYITGMVTRFDPIDGSVTGTAIFPDYWGDFNGGRSFIEDPLTGKVYAIRDMRTGYIGEEDYDASKSASVLCTIELGVAHAEQICEIGTGLRVTGLFIK